MNMIFKNPKNKKPMSVQSIKDFVLDSCGVNYFTPDRVEGKMCNCEPNKGEFVLNKPNSKLNQEGGKLYMKCRVCNEYSHL